jgi:hypothetical protein
MPRSAGKLLIAGVCLALMSGCSIFLSGRSQLLKIEASDPAARIYVDEVEVGVGKAEVTVRRDSPHTVVARAGHRGASAFVGLEFSTAAYFDMFLAVPTLGITAALGSMSGGFWVLERDEVRLTLPPR